MSAGGGYNLLGCVVQSKEEQPLDVDYLKRYICVQCEFILREASQMECGHRMCRSCVPMTPFKCSLCKDPVDPTTKQGVFIDRSCQKDIKGLVVSCKCGVKIKLEQWEEHCEICPEILKDRPKPSPQEQLEIIRTVKRIELDVRTTRSEVSEMKKISNNCVKKVEAMEKEVKGIKIMVEEIQRLGGKQHGKHSSSDIQRINDRLDQVNDIITQLVADVEQHKGTISQMNSSVEGTSKTITRYENIMEELNLKVEILEVKSCTGVYVWKVNELARRMREARVGRTVSLYSPPFYTSIHGYRICLRAYLNGDGDGKNTHISLFIVLMKAEYDDLLAWPFSYRVTLSLVNQVHPLNPSKSMTHKFSPNPESSSFQKPQDTFNIASGFPKFTEVKVLDDPEFNRNDTIYFRVKLDRPSSPTGPDHMDYLQ